MKSLHSIYTKILLTIFIFFVLPLTFVFFYGYNSLESIIQQKIEQQAKTNFDNLHDSLQNTVNMVNQTASYISTDNRISDLLTYYNNHISKGQSSSYSWNVPDFMSKYEYLQYATEIHSQLANYISNWLPEGSEISLLLNDGQFFCTWSTYNTDFDVLTEILDSHGTDTYFSGTHEPLIRYSDTGQQFSMVKNIYSIYDTRQMIAKVIITIPVSTLERILASYQNDQLFSFYVLDSQKGMIAQALGTDTQAEDALALINEYDDLSTSSNLGLTLHQVFINSYSMTGPLWRIYLLAPYSNIFHELFSLRQTVIGTGLLLIILLTVASLLRLYHLLSPLRSLTHSMYQIEKEHWAVKPLPVRSQDEIGSLTEGFNHLITQLNQMIEQVKESERQKGELKFEMLLAQINPHFLFNTLNSIKWMAMMIRADNIVATIRSLARLLEISMNRQTDVISVQDEIENLKSYLDIQSLRYNGLFTVTYDLDPSLEELECLKLVFQPFVENAIFYNIQEEKSLEIHITGKLKEQKNAPNIIIFHIIDNGKGMSQERIRQVLNNDATHEKSVFRGIGINNVRQRIQAKYGNDYGISITSEPGKGLDVQIFFPAIPFTQTSAEPTLEKGECKND